MSKLNLCRKYQMFKQEIKVYRVVINSGKRKYICNLGTS